MTRSEPSRAGFRQPNMARFTSTLLLWILVLCACTPNASSAEAVPQTAPPTTQLPAAISITTKQAPPDITALPGPKLNPTIETPHIDQPPDGATTVAPSKPQDCGYQWANKDLPELSTSFQRSIQALNPSAQAVAFGFGENCVHSDGTLTFLPMETDFSITLPVSDLSDEANLGEWIVKVMQVIENIPLDQIIGPRPGRVSLIFESNGQNQGVSFYIDQYRALAAGLSDAEIYQTLKVSQ